MIEAYSLGDGTYKLYDNKGQNKHHNTFNCRELIKAHGGKPFIKDDKFKYWIVPATALAAIGAVKIYKVITPKYCHIEEKQTLANELDINKGYIILGCALCDSFNIKVPIKQVLEEYIAP